METNEPTLTLEELSEEVGQLLNRYALLGAQQDNRVSAIPDARTIRYYTTLGLIDRPKIHGRQARYGRRHVLQILAIKALQAINLPLSEIQTRLFGRNDVELEAMLSSLSDFWEKKKSDRVEKEKNDKKDAAKATTWTEITVEPGVKVLIQQGYQSKDEIEATMKRIRLALEANLPDTGES